MIKTKSALMLAVLASAEGQAKRSQKPILILGETGTGKTTLAQQIHAWGGRPGPFVRVNCANLSETLGESELFGHTRYAFTDAKEAKQGRVADAEKGTLFLDEIGELSPGLQKKILDLLDVKTYRPVGTGAKEMTADVRIIAATHRDLVAMVAEGKFREDLLMRLRLRVEMPSLRDRGEDKLDIIADLCRDGGYDVSPDVIDVLAFGSYPGNIRQLDGVLESAHVECWTVERAREEVRKMGPAPVLARPVASAVPCEGRMDVAVRLSEGGAWWSAAELALACGIAKPTLWATLAAWVEDGTLEKKGKASAVRYRVAMHGHASQCNNEAAGGEA